MTEPRATDADSARVEEILIGAMRANKDPDVELARMLVEIETGDSDFLAPYLERLVRDAYKD